MGVQDIFVYFVQFDDGYVLVYVDVGYRSIVGYDVEIEQFFYDYKDVEFKDWQEDNNSD